MKEPVIWWAVDPDTGLKVTVATMGDQYGAVFDSDVMRPYIEMTADRNGRTGDEIAFHLLRDRKLTLEPCALEEERLP